MKYKLVSIEKATDFLLADNTYRKDVYLILNENTTKYAQTDTIHGKAVCRVDRAQCMPSLLKDYGFINAFIPMEKEAIA